MCQMRSLAFVGIRHKFSEFVDRVGLTIDDRFFWGGSPETLANNLIVQAARFGETDKITKYLKQFEPYYNADEFGYPIYQDETKTSIG